MYRKISTGEIIEDNAYNIIANPKTHPKVLSPLDDIKDTLVNKDIVEGRNNRGFCKYEETYRRRSFLLSYIYSYKKELFKCI